MRHEIPFFAATVDDSVALDALISNWDLTLPNSLGYGHLNATARADITRSVNALYFGNEATPTNQLDKQALLNVSVQRCVRLKSETKSVNFQMFTDRFLIFIESVQGRLAESNHGGTFLYIFSHKGKASFSRTTSFFGTSHADDLIPVFPLRKTSFYSSIPSRQDRELTDVMSLMYTNFARFG